MDETLKLALQQAPALTVLVVLVFLFLKMFLKYLQDVTTQHAARTNEFIAMVRIIQEENKVARERSTEVIDKNTTALASIETLLSEWLHISHKNETRRREN